MKRNFHLTVVRMDRMDGQRLIMIMAGLFVTVSFIGDEVRAALIGLAIGDNCCRCLDMGPPLL